MTKKIQKFIQHYMQKPKKIQILLLKKSKNLVKYKDKLKNSSLKQQLSIAFALSLLSFLVFNNKGKVPSSKKHIDQKLELNMNTFIPAGFVLIPINLLNGESLNGLIGKWGWISLYSSLPNQNTKPIVSSIRVLRSPKNPNQFAVLAEERKSSLILAHTAPLIAVIQSLKTKKTKFTVKKNIKKNKIIIEN